MSRIQYRNFIPEDIPQVVELQKAYRAKYPHASVVPGEVYLSAGFEQGRNIFCAFDETGKLQGYAPLFPTLAEQPGFPHILWVEVKANPASDSIHEVKEALFRQVLGRAREIARAHADRPARLSFQYHPGEVESIDFICAHGLSLGESVYRLWRDLSKELKPVPEPAGVEVREWKMESIEEQRAYVLARNEAFPESTVTLQDWQNFLASPEWKDGTSITAFDGGEVVGSVIAYWDDNLSAQLGSRIGFTEYIFVRPAWRGRSIAPYMIHRALEYLKERGREAATLEVKALNENALRLYYQLGYVKVDETRLYGMEVS